MNIDEEIRLIADRMIELRPPSQVVYRPYRKQDIISFEDILSYMKIDLMKLYPDAKDGECAYVKTILYSDADHDITIRVRGNVKVIFNGEIVYEYERQYAEQYDILTYANAGENELIFICRCSGEKFGVDFIPSVRYYPGMWAKDYLLNIRPLCPMDEFSGEDGVAVSALLCEEDEFLGEYVYPKIEADCEIRFNNIFPDAAGKIGFAYTECIGDTELKIKKLSECRIFVNGIERTGRIHLIKGDKVLVESKRDMQWGFEYEPSEDIGIPFMVSQRGCGDRWLTVAGFSEGEMFEPQFEKPYNTADGKRIFWKLEHRNDYLRPYVDSCFYAQWFYAVMVGHYGLKKAGEALEEKRYTDYFKDSMNDMARFYMYIQYEREEFVMPSFMQRASKPVDLDSIGTMGMNMCELYSAEHTGDAFAAALELYRAMRRNIPTFDDGTFNRRETMWSDDTFMSCPFLVRLGNILGDMEVSDLAAKQLMGFIKKLYIKDKNIFSHIYFVKEQQASLVPWGRGNGWVFVTLSDALELLPKTTVYRAEIAELFKEFADGIRRLQGADGLWHQVLDRSDSYEETSCTAMFLIGMCKGVRNGLLDMSYIKTIKMAHDGIMKTAIDKVGNVYGVCRGSSCSMDPEYYMRLGVVENDDHGTGIILWALNEIKKLNIDM